MAIIQTRLTASVGKGVEKPKLVCLAGRNVNIKWCSFPLQRTEAAPQYSQQSYPMRQHSQVQTREKWKHVYAKAALVTVSQQAETTQRSSKPHCIHIKRDAALTRASACAVRRQTQQTHVP